MGKDGSTLPITAWRSSGLLVVTMFIGLFGEATVAVFQSASLVSLVMVFSIPRPRAHIHHIPVLDIWDSSKSWSRPKRIRFWSSPINGGLDHSGNSRWHMRLASLVVSTDFVLVIIFSFIGTRGGIRTRDWLVLQTSAFGHSATRADKKGPCRFSKLIENLQGPN